MPASGRTTQPGAQTSVLEAVLGAARAFRTSLYQSTAHEVRALGVGLDESLFERAAVVYADRVIGTPEAAGNALAEIEERGYFDLVLDGQLRLRVIVDE